MRSRSHQQLNVGEDILGGSGSAADVFDRGGFLLTDQRVVHVMRAPLGGGSTVHSIGLESLDSIQTQTRRSMALLVIGIAFAIAAVSSPTGPSSGLFFALGVGGIAAYVLLKQRTVRLVSTNSVMVLPLHGQALEQAEDLVAAVEEAKQSRLLRLERAARDPATGSGTAADRLRRLAALRSEGLISEEEYHARREAFLASL